MGVARAFLGLFAGVFAVLLMAVAGLTMAAHGQEGEEPLPPRPRAQSPRELYLRDCVYCHGPDGRGTAQGPSLKESGTASVDFMVSTGRMPLEFPQQEVRRRLPKYTKEEIRGLVEYVGTFISGPPVTEVEPNPEHVAKGGELYRLHCAACHQVMGTGGVLIGAQPAPTLMSSSVGEVAAAIRTGPGTMPRFSEGQLSEEEVAEIASFVALEVQRSQDLGGFSTGHYGPFAEGFVAWFFGLGAMLAATLWIGRRT